MTDYPVTNDSEFASAFASAGSGDTITMANGNYSGLTTTKTVSGTPLTIRASTRYTDGGTAAFTTRWYLNGVSGLTFDGLNFTQGIERNSGANSDLVFQYGRIAALLRLTTLTNGLVQYNDLPGPWTQMSNGSNNVTIKENYFHDVKSDVMQVVGDAVNINILDNVIFDMWSADAGTDPHWDLGIQTFTSEGSTPSNLTYRGNIIIDDPATQILKTNPPGGVGLSQGLFFGGPSSGYADFTIEENMLWVQNSDGIAVQNAVGTGFVVRNNSLINGSIRGYNQASFAAFYVNDCIAAAITDQGLGGPAPIQNGNVTFASATDVFEDPGTTVYNILDYRRFIPKTAYATKGAATRIAEIQSGVKVFALNLAGMPAVGSGGGSITPSRPRLGGKSRIYLGGIPVSL